MKRKQKRILISRPDRLGDVVLSTPLPREIKKKYPDSFVAVLVREYTKAVFLHNPYVDAIIIFDPDRKGKDYFLQKRKEIASFGFTDALMLLPNEKINYLLFLSGIPNRIGVGTKLFQVITLTKSVSRNKYIPLRHEADYCMDLAREIGVNTFDIRTEIFLTEEELSRSKNIRRELSPKGEKIVLLHTTSGQSAPNLSQHEYVRLAEKILSDGRFSLVITDMEISAELKRFEEKKYPVQNLRDLFIIIKSGDVIISSSTGPAHVAAALNVRTLTLFCPLPACSPMLWSPMGNDANYILPDENYCANQCPGDPHICDYSGQGGLTAEHLFAELEKLLT